MEDTREKNPYLLRTEIISSCALIAEVSTIPPRYVFTNMDQKYARKLVMFHGCSCFQHRELIDFGEMFLVRSLVQKLFN